jgi:hypothetical protein
MPKNDLTGKKFGKLIAICFQGSNGRHCYWLCRCDCGKKVAPHIEDEGLSDAAELLIASGILTALAGIFFACIAVAGLIDGFAATKTAEYDSYQDLIYDWKD